MNNIIEITKHDTVFYIKPRWCVNDADVGTVLRYMPKEDEPMEYGIYDEKIEIILSKILVKIILKNNTAHNFSYNNNIVKVEQISDLLTDCKYMFSNCYKLVDITNLKIPSHIKNCSFMFALCDIESLDGFELPEDIEDMTSMFLMNNIIEIENFIIPKNIKRLHNVFDDNPINSVINLKIPKGAKYDINRLFITVVVNNMETINNIF